MQASIIGMAFYVYQSKPLLLAHAFSFTRTMDAILISCGWHLEGNVSRILKLRHRLHSVCCNCPAGVEEVQSATLLQTFLNVIIAETINC